MSFPGLGGLHTVELGRLPPLVRRCRSAHARCHRGWRLPRAPAPSRPTGGASAVAAAQRAVVAVNEELPGTPPPVASPIRPPVPRCSPANAAPRLSSQPCDPPLIRARQVTQTSAPPDVVYLPVLSELRTSRLRRATRCA